MPIICNNGDSPKNIDMGTRCYELQPGAEVCVGYEVAQEVAYEIACDPNSGLEVKKDITGPLEVTLVPEVKDAETEILCDVQPDGTSIGFWAIPTFSQAGVFESIVYGTLADPSVVYVPTGTVEKCPEYDVKTWCVENPAGVKYQVCQQIKDGVPVPGALHYQNPDGSIATIDDTSVLKFCDAVEPCIPMFEAYELEADGVQDATAKARCIKVSHVIGDDVKDGTCDPVVLTINGDFGSVVKKVKRGCDYEKCMTCEAITGIEISGLQNDGTIINTIEVEFCN